MKNQLISLSSGVSVRSDKDGLVSLNDLFEASGSPANKDPRQWKRKEGASFIAFTTEFLNVPEKHIIKGQRGAGGGTYAHKQVALAYAKYLSHELHMTVNNAFFERIEEEKNPELAINRAMTSWEKKGKTTGWISKRIQSIATRKEFTKTLGNAGVVRDGFRDCTNAIYMPLFGGSAGTVRAKYQMPEKANTREHMSEIQLAAVELAEMISAQNIQKKGLFGNDACIHECNTTSRIIASSVSQALQKAA